MKSVFAVSSKAMFSLVLASFSSCALAAPTIDEVLYDVQEKKVVVNGVGFGPAPHVVMFENFEAGEKYSKHFSTISDPWFEDVILHKEPSGNFAHRAKDHDRVAIGGSGQTQLDVEFQKHYSAAFVSFSVKVPDGTTFPGASEEETFPSHSSWKFSWLMSGTKGYAGGDGFDVCLPSHVGDGRTVLGGNDGTIVWLTKAQNWWEWDEYNHMTSYIEFDAAQPELHPIQYSWTVKNNITKLEHTGTKSTDLLHSENFKFDRIRIPGWWGNGDTSRFDGLYDNIYVATGENARARVVLTDSEDFSKSNIEITLFAELWSDSKIVLDESLIPSGRHYYIHVFDRENASSRDGVRVCPSCPVMM